MTMNPFEQSRQQLLHYLTSNAEQEVIDYIRQEMQHDAPDSIPTEEELFAFFQSPDEPTKLDAYQQMLATDKLLEYAEISLRTVCDLIRYCASCKTAVSASIGSVPARTDLDRDILAGHRKHFFSRRQILHFQQTAFFHFCTASLFTKSMSYHTSGRIFSPSTSTTAI